jgi:hypothetical protein
MNLAARERTTKGLLIAASAFLLAWGMLRARVFASNVTATWSYDYGPEPACSLTQNNNCIDHFEVEDITDQHNFVLIQRVPNPDKVFGKVDHISVSFKYGPPFGQRTISVIAVGKDSTGERVTSNPFAARATANILPRTQVSFVF